MPIGSAAKPKAAARRRGGDCAASESSGRVRARRIRPVRRLRRHWSRAPALWQLCGKRASCVPIHLVGSSHERSARTCRAAQAHELVRAWERGSERASWGHTVVIHQPDAQRPTNTDRCGGRLEESQVRDGRDVRPVLPAVRVRAAVLHIPRACRHRERRRHKAVCSVVFLAILPGEKYCLKRAESPQAESFESFAPKRKMTNHLTGGPPVSSTHDA